MKKVSLLAAVVAIGLCAPAQAGAPETAVFAGGCFWCLESDFDKLDGVVSTTSGYTGGTVENPGYEQVSNGGTGHYEAVKVEYDPEKVSYSALVDYFWRHVDPFDDKGQFCDRGDQYRAAVFYQDKTQAKQSAESKKRAEATLGKSISTQIIPASTFYSAEDYHQNYYQTHTTKYKFYRWKCGRDQRVEDVWGAPGH
ncbi:MAG: peptide-methionine (S)-S-oxide reductase MsrA [Alphaproteobacteria bacterium]|nr:peptide-methionine (S)-S-oxide reductase MsrA [Alphaproteobacteria bacterium]